MSKIKQKNSNEETVLFTQDWIPVESVAYGMIKLKPEYGGSYVKILEIEPINFMLRSVQERADIISGMYSWLKIAPSSLQFQMTSSKADVSDLIRSIKKRTKDETDPVVLKRRDLYIEKIRNLATSDALSKKFYLIYKYEGSDIDGSISDKIEEIAETMWTTANLIKSYFNKVGNAIVEHENETIFLASLVYRSFNPRSYMTEPFDNRFTRINEDNMIYYLSKDETYEDKTITEDNYFAPKGLDRQYRDYVIMDGTYITYLYVKGDGYRHNVTSGWMEVFTNFGEGVDVNLYAKKRDRYRTIKNTRRIKLWKNAEAKDSFRSEETSETLLSAAANADFVQSALAENNEDLYDVFTMLTVRAESERDLAKMTSHIKKVLQSKDIIVEDTVFHNEEATIMSAPLLIINQKLFKKGRRNFLTSSLASTYFFTAFETYDANGFLLGINAANSSLAVVDPFNHKVYKNGNITVVGTAGSGKTYLLQQLGYAFRACGIPVFYILPYKGYEYFKACKAINGEYITLAPGSSSCINIMEIRPQAEADASMVDEDYEDEPFLSKKIRQIITFIQLLKTKELMTDAEETLLSVTLTQLYSDFGITDDNESIWIDKEKRLLKEMPIIGDLYERCVADAVLRKRVAVALRIFIDGPCKNMNGQTNVNLENKFTVFDVSNTGDKLRPAFSFIATDCSFDRIKRDLTENGAMIMDEVWQMMINDYCAGTVRDIFKVIRGYGGIAVAATQDISDFLSYDGGVYGRYGRKILSNSRIKFLLGAEKAELEAISDTVDISEEELKMLSKYERGQALMMANGDKTPIYIAGTEEETAIFTTDARVKQQLAKRHM